MISIPAWIFSQDLNDRDFFMVKFICQKCHTERIINIVSSEQYVMFGSAFTSVHSKCQESLLNERTGLAK
jgi:hypothetical protein